MMPSDNSTPVPRAKRLHPLSPAFAAGAAAWRLLIPALLVIFFNRGDATILGIPAEAWFGLFIFPAIVQALVRYATFRYWLRDSELVIRQGVFTRNERHVPYDRIQNIDLSQNPFHRLCRVAEVRLETAGGSEPEAHIKVLSLQAIDELRARVFHERTQVDAGLLSVEEGLPGEPSAAVAATGTQPPPGPERHEVLHLDLKEIAIYGIISNRGMAIVAAAVGLFWQAGYQGFLPERWTITSERVGRWVESASGNADSWLTDLLPQSVASPVSSTISAVLLIVVALVLLRLFSIIWAIIKLYGFCLTRAGADLRTSFGLLTRMSATVPRHRIQLLRVRQSVLHRLFGRAEIRVETAGAGAENGEASEVSRQLLAPLVRVADLPRLLGEIQPELRLEALEWQLLHPKAWRRILRRRLYLAIPLSAALIWWSGWWSVLAVPLMVSLLVIPARLGFRRIAWAAGEHGIAYRSGWWSRDTSVAAYAKIQALEMAQSPFDRRYRMATLSVDTAGASQSGHRIRIRYLLADRARALFDDLSHQVARTEFHW